MTLTDWQKPRQGDRVQIQADAGPLRGTVQRVWGTRAVNVTVKTDDGRTFVRLARETILVDRSGEL